MATFTYRGTVVELWHDPDDWLAPELRAIERVIGCGLDEMTNTDKTAAVVLVSLKRAFPDKPIAVLDAGLTMGEIRAAAEAVAVALADETATANVEPGAFPAPDTAPIALPQGDVHDLTGAVTLTAASTDGPGELIPPGSAGSEA